ASILEGFAHAATVPALTHRLPVREPRLDGNGARDDAVAEAADSDGRVKQAAGVRPALERLDGIVDVARAGGGEKPGEILSAHARGDAGEVVERRLCALRGVHELAHDRVEDGRAGPALQRAERPQHAIAAAVHRHPRAQIAGNETAEVPAFRASTIHGEVLLVDDLRYDPPRSVLDE